MLSSGFFEALKIDDLNRKWGVRVLFLVLLCLEFSFYFFDIGDSNFEAFYSFYNGLISNPSAAQYITYSQIPLTRGNLIYLAYNLFVILANVVGSFIYCGLYIKDFRENSRELPFLNRPFIIRVRATTDEAKAMNLTEDEVIDKLISKLPTFKAISAGKLVFRIFIMTIITILLLFPCYLLIYYLPFILIMILPSFMLAISSYLSGDYLFLDSFAAGFKKIKGFYFGYMSGVTTLVLIFVIAEFLFASVEVVNYSWVYALLSFVTVFFSMTMGRYMGVEHCIINDSFAKLFKKKQQM